MTTGNADGSFYSLGASYGRVLDDVETAAVNAAWWDGRATSRDQGAARRAGREAIDAIDAALRGLHTLREELITELARFDREALDGAR